MFKNALTIPTGAGPAAHLFLLMVAKLTMDMPKNDQDLVDIFIKFAKNNQVSYKTVQGKQVWQFLPGVEIAIKGDIESDNIGVSSITINNKKVTVSNFNDFIVMLMKSLLSEKVFQVWDTLSSRLQILSFQKMFK
jgi:hypothetical protein